ncbi:hypothetical protein [Roseomonas sp. 18066]|uniref:hypothetical protein n=1 Tax=Roseomonas sp. 18066 TaxID=2681412 RepID=UPI001357A57E|nr:hypothetical protein [Roseomonas sp. 18066]
MLNHDLSRRLDRMLQGIRRADDLDRIFLALRDRPGARPSVREVGDFIAHRDQRQKGPVTQKARDIFTSSRSWLRVSIMQEPATLDDIRKAAEANLRIATDMQLEASLGFKRAAARTALAQAVRRLEGGRQPTPRERKTFDYLGSAFIWNPAFTGAEVLKDLEDMLGELGLMRKVDHASFRSCRDFIILHVVTVMHGSSILLEGGDRADMAAGFSNREGRLEVRAWLSVKDLPKPVFMPACLFWTDLDGVGHCGQALLEDPRRWQEPLEIDTDGKLAPLG